MNQESGHGEHHLRLRVWPQCGPSVTVCRCADRRGRRPQDRDPHGGSMTKFVYSFGEGDRDQKDLLGGKGANPAEMAPVAPPPPPGFTITTEPCRAYLADGHEPAGLADEVTEHLDALEKTMGRSEERRVAKECRSRWSPYH